MSRTSAVTSKAVAWGRQAVKVSAAVADRVRPPRPGVVVLTYHRVGARSPMTVDLPTPLFEEQMAELAASGRVVTLDRAIDLLAEPGARTGSAIPDDSLDPVVLTFDDGTTDLAEVATPILERHGLPATLYPHGWTKVSSLHVSSHGRFVTATLYPTRTTWYIVRYAGGDFPAFTPVVRVRVR